MSLAVIAESRKEGISHEVKTKGTTGLDWRDEALQGRYRLRQQLDYGREGERAPTMGGGWRHRCAAKVRRKWRGFRLGTDETQRNDGGNGQERVKERWPLRKRGFFTA